METHRFLNDYLESKNLQPVTMVAFNKLFNELDVNRDDVLSRVKIAKLVSKFEIPKMSGLDETNNMVIDKVDEIFKKYDVDGSGVLEKRECLNVINDILTQKGLPRASAAQFNRYFAEVDTNDDGVLSRGELAKIVKKF